MTRLAGEFVDPSVICRWGKGDRIGGKRFHEQLAIVIRVYIIYKRDKQVITSPDEVKKLLDAAEKWLGDGEYEEVLQGAIKDLEAVASGQAAPVGKVEVQNILLRKDRSGSGLVALPREAIQALLQERRALVREKEARIHEDEEWLQREEAFTRQLERLLKLEED